MFHLFDHAEDQTECASCQHRSLVAHLDALGAELHDPLAELVRILKAPVAVVQRGGDALFDTMTLNDLVPVRILGKSLTRRSITIVNASPAGGANVIVGRDETASPTNASKFVLLPQSSITMASRGPLYVVPSAAGAIVSLAMEEDPEQ